MIDTRHYTAWTNGNATQLRTLASEFGLATHVTRTPVTWWKWCPRYHITITGSAPSLAAFDQHRADERLEATAW